MFAKAANKLLTQAPFIVSLQAVTCPLLSQTCLAKAASSAKQESLSAQLAQYGNKSALLADSPPLAPHPIQDITRGLPLKLNQTNRGKGQREGEPGKDKQDPKVHAIA